MINRRSFLQTISAAAVSLSAYGKAIESQRRPNIVVILADDLGYGDLGCYGNTRIQTPNQNALAKDGIRFTDFHSSGAVCSPTRAGLLTGRYQQRCGVPVVISAKNHRDHGLSPNEITFSKQLKAAGYATGIFGKWHLGYHPRFNPDKHGFDRFRGYVSGNVDYISHIDQTGAADWWDNSTPIEEEGYTTHLITKHAVSFIEENKDSPFCLYVAHEAPHYPYQGPNDKADRTIGGSAPNHGTRKDIAGAYKEMIEEMDKGVGEIVTTLRRCGLEQNTLIFFFSDNGAMKYGSNGPLHGFKGSLWEGGHRVPAIAYWPGKIAPGQTSNQTTISLDLFPTMIALGGVSIPQEHKIDGANLLPLLTNNKRIKDRTLFWAYQKQKAVRKGSWKFIVFEKEMEREYALFNLDEDLGEKINLVWRYPKLVEELLEELGVWEREVSLGKE